MKNFKSLNYIKQKIKSIVEKKLNTKTKIDLNKFYQYINKIDLNEFRLHIINRLNSDKYIRHHYFKIGKQNLFNLVGNELMMQKSLNLSIQLPNDSSSLLPIHSDVWSGDSPFEINFWLPLVNCYRTKSMYILKPKDYDFFLKEVYLEKAKMLIQYIKRLKKK
jgi:sporadic carbohydrate cluster 2OG-Fe(II) oxygenase